MIKYKCVSEAEKKIKKSQVTSTTSVHSANSPGFNAFLESEIAAATELGFVPGAEVVILTSPQKVHKVKALLSNPSAMGSKVYFIELENMSVKYHYSELDLVCVEPNTWEDEVIGEC